MVTESLTAFLEKLFFRLGVLFCILGTVFFFAYNWKFLPFYVKFGSVVFLYSGLQFYLTRMLNSFRYEAFLFFLQMCLVGQILFLYGQNYQTGANAFYLFLAWFFFSTFPMLSSRSNLCFFLWVFLGNLVILLYASEILYVSRDSYLYIALGIWNLLLFLFYLLPRGLPFFPRKTWGLHLLFVIFLIPCGLLLLEGVFSNWADVFLLTTTGIISLLLIGFFIVFRRRKPYSTGIQLIYLFLLFYGNTLCIHFLEWESPFSFLVQGFLLSGMTLFFLYRISRWEGEALASNET